jgi:hypothetical protein
MCSQKHFLHTSQDIKTENRTKMGPNTRLEAIRDTQDDILTSLKRISRYTTDVNTKKLYAMSYEDFNCKHTALPRYKRLCDRTIKVTMDGQMLAPRRTKHEYHYRLFGDLQEILQYEHDRLLEIEEAMESLRDLHEFRYQHTFKPVKETTPVELKPVKNRPPTPATLLRLKDIIDLIPSPSPERFRSLTPLPVSPSGYTSTGSSSSESTTTTTTTIRTSWNNPTNYSSRNSSSSSDDSRFYR